jgi:hypothetical protein
MKRKGLALIAVIVMIVLFTSLILAVVLSATMSIRRANYYKDKLIALEIAETGLQKVLYNMNYLKYGNGQGHYYPFGENPSGITISKPNYYPNYPDNIFYFQYDTDIDVSEFGKKAECKISLIDANLNTSDPTSYDTDLDILIATGKYKGRTARIMCRIRGANQAGGDLDGNNYDSFSPPRTKGTCGIPEAFNKHVIYADTLAGNGTNVTIKGNITCKNYNFTGSYTTQSETTLTETNIDFMNYLPRFETEICSFVIPSLPPTIPPTPPYTGYYARYTNNGMVCIPPDATPGTRVNNQNDGVYWDNASKTYYFGTDDRSNPTNFTSQGNILVEANAIIPNYAGNVTISHYFHVEGSTTPNINGDLTINKSITTTTTNPDFCFVVKGNLTIAPGITINGDLVVKGQPLNLNIYVNGNVKCDQDITINGGTIDKDVISNGGNITVNNGNIRENLEATGDITIQNGNINIGKDVLSKSNITINAGTINGCVLCYDNSSKTHTITISNNPIINASNSSYDAGIYIYNNSPGSSGTININGSPTIILGEKQKAGIVICVPYGANSININNPFTLKYYNPLNPSQPSNYPFNQFAIVNYGASNSAINTNINTNLNLNGAIYSSGNITFNNNTQNIKGLVVAGNTLTIGNNTNISYYPDQYKNNNSDAFRGFLGGRRKYLPVPGSWRIEW